MRADLHLHTSASDGALSPAQTMEYAARKGIEAVAITDHDTVFGIAEGKAEAEKLGLKFVPGIELSSVSSCEIHVLGYNFDYTDSEFLNELSAIQDMRRERNVKIGAKLEALGVKPDMDFSADGIGRMNIARAMVRCGFVRDAGAAFERYLGKGGAAFCTSERLTPILAVTLIKKYGGLAVIAHPKKLMNDKKLDALLCGLKPYGLGGLEIYYPGHTEQDLSALNALAKKYGLAATGGSDFHGEEDKKIVFEPDSRTARILKIE